MFLSFAIIQFLWSGFLLPFPIFDFISFYSLPTREGGGRVFLFHVDHLAVNALLCIFAQPHIEVSFLYAEIHILVP